MSRGKVAPTSPCNSAVGPPFQPHPLSNTALVGQTPGMTPALASALTPLLRQMEAERAHRLAITSLRLGLAGHDRTPDDPALATRVFGLSFPNPIGLAAGFDKDAAAIRPLRRLGFGAIEVGTVTPRPQPGNPIPRVFRLPEDRAVINRYGLNNRGIAPFVRNLARVRRGSVPVGVNVGINKEGADPERDYAALIAAVTPFADYVVINVSSPNTPGLRDLQGPAHLRGILASIASLPHRPPLLVKIAPDQAPGALAGTVEACVEGGADGMIVSNTTVARPDTLRGAHRQETGGLSGAPLRDASTAILRDTARLAAGRLVLIGCGGVATGADALDKIMAGATLVQLYTAFSIDGPAIVGRIKRELSAALRARGFASVRDAIGAGL